MHGDVTALLHLSMFLCYVPCKNIKVFNKLLNSSGIWKYFNVNNPCRDRLTDILNNLFPVLTGNSIPNGQHSLAER